MLAKKCVELQQLLAAGQKQISNHTNVSKTNVYNDVSDKTNQSKTNVNSEIDGPESNNNLSTNVDIGQDGAENTYQRRYKRAAFGGTDWSLVFPLFRVSATCNFLNSESFSKSIDD